MITATVMGYMFGVLSMKVQMYKNTFLVQSVLNPFHFWILTVTCIYTFTKTSFGLVPKAILSSWQIV